MKINKREATILTIDTVLACCCTVTTLCITKPTFNTVYDATEWLPSWLTFILSTIAMIFVVIVLIALFIVLVIVVEFAFSDELQAKLAKQSEEREAESQTKVAIRSNHGDSFKEVMEAIRYEEWEYYAFFNFSGKKLAEGTYRSPESCNITTEDWQEVKRCGGEVIGLHNHPGRDSSFSPQDFKAFMQYDFIKQFIVVSRRYNYILVKPKGGYEGIQDEVKSYAEMMDRRYFWLEIISFWLWSVITAKKTAEKFGLEFRVERAPQPTARKNAFRIGLATCVILALCSIGLLRPAESSVTSPVSVASGSGTARYSSPVEATTTINGVTYSLTDDVIPVSCDPTKDPCIQGRAHVGGGPNYSN